MERKSLWDGRDPDKDRIRQQMWQKLIQAGVISPAFNGKIPAFSRAKEAAQQLERIDLWSNANTIKCNPDQAQIPVRRAALEQGKQLFMAVPRLVQPYCFVSLTKAKVHEAGLTIAEAAIAQNALSVGTPISFQQMPSLDLVVVGCVAADCDGGRTGKGAGFADLELAMLREFGLVNDQTPVVSTVDELQVVQESLPMQSHDWPLDWVITPTRAIGTHTPYLKPQGIDWDAIQPDQWQTIPILRILHPASAPPSLEFEIFPVNASDAEQLLAGVNQVIAEQRYLGAAEPFSLTAQKSYLHQILTLNQPMVVAKCGGRIIGACDIIPYPELGFRHVGRLGMWVLPNLRRKGVGRSLLVSCLDLAKRFGLEKVELQVYGDNSRAIALYQSVGFFEEGIRQRSRKLNGTYQDLIQMGLFLM